MLLKKKALLFKLLVIFAVFNSLNLLKMLLNMVVTYSLFLAVTNTVFVIGVFGICFNGGSFIRVLLCFELLLVCVSLNFIFFSACFLANLGFVYVLCLLAVSAGELALGLGLLLYSFFISKSVDIVDKVVLRG